MYGTHITDPYDQQSLSAIIDYWCSPNAVKKDFEVARLKYRAPQAFFNPNVRLNTLIQSLDSITNHYLEVPEACHLHPNIEVRSIFGNYAHIKKISSYKKTSLQKNVIHPFHVIT